MTETQHISKHECNTCGTILNMWNDIEHGVSLGRPRRMIPAQAVYETGELMLQPVFRSEVARKTSAPTYEAGRGIIFMGGLNKDCMK